MCVEDWPCDLLYRRNAGRGNHLRLGLPHHAGVDNFAKFCKMTVFERRGDRVIVLLSSGNLAGTQAVIGVLNQRCAAGDDAANLWSARTMFDVAMLVSDAMRDIERRDGEYLEESEIGFNASFIVGGQISGEPMRLFRIYAEGNFIEAGVDTPYFQTGETKYGKPIIDRVITRRDAPRRRHEVRAGVVRFDHAQQPVGGHADRPDLLRAGQPRSARGGADSTTATRISPRSATNGAKARARCFAICPSCAGDRSRCPTPSSSPANTAATAYPRLSRAVSGDNGRCSTPIADTTPVRW